MKNTHIIKIRVGNYKNTQVFNVGGIKVKVLYIYLCIYMGKINCSPKNFFLVPFFITHLLKNLIYI